MAPKQQKVWSDFHNTWLRSEDYFRDAPFQFWRRGHETEEQRKANRQWQGGVGWMGRAASRLDAEAEAGEPSAQRPLPDDENEAEELKLARKERLGQHLAAGFNPGRHVWFVLGRPVVVGRS